jgi:cation-transporting ATPase 13A3/4/5
MNPNDKTKLVQLFKKQNPNNIVGMCGDGANDCSALISADVGVSLKSRENIIMTSHLMAKTKSIAIINDIINIGKACYENSTIILKILLLYSEIKTCSRCLLKKYNDNLTRGQYFYLDCIIILFGCCLMSLSDPNYKIKEKTFSKLLVNKIYLISIIGHSIAQLGILIIYFFCVIDRNHYYKKNVIKANNDIYSDDITTVNSYIFFLNSVQCLSLVFMLNYFSICKQSLFKSRTFTLYLILICLTLTEILSLENFDMGIFKLGLVKFVQLNNEGTNSQNSRIILFIFCLGSFLITMIWEFFLNWFFSMNYSKYLKKEDEKISKKLKKSYRQKSMVNFR